MHDLSTKHTHPLFYNYKTLILSIINIRAFIRFQLYRPTFLTKPPYSVEMQDYQIFGAAKYNGVWKGIRIMKR